MARRAAVVIALVVCALTACVAPAEATSAISNQWQFAGTAVAKLPRDSTGAAVMRFRVDHVFGDPRPHAGLVVGRTVDVTFPGGTNGIRVGRQYLVRGSNQLGRGILSVVGPNYTTHVDGSPITAPWPAWIKATLVLVGALIIVAMVVGLVGVQRKRAFERAWRDRLAREHPA